MPFEVVSQKGFLKGVIASMDRFNITKGAIQRSSNFLLSQRGALTVCDGTKVLATGGVTQPIEEIGMYVNPNTFAVTPLAGAPDGAGNLNIFSWLLAGGAFTSIGALPLTAGWDMPQFTNFAGVTCIALGNGIPLVKYDGSAFTNLGGGTPGVGTTPLSVIPPWQANTFYQIGQRIAEPSANVGGSGTTMSTWQVVNVTIQGNPAAGSGSISNSSGIGSGGLSGATMPNFTSTDGIQGTGHTTHDNQIIWMCIKQDLGALATTFPPRGGAHIITHANSLWAFNTSPTTVAANGSMDGPSVLRMSDPNNADSWPLGNTTIIGKDDGSQGTGLGTFTIAEAGITPSGTLVAFKDYSTYTVTGVFQAQNFQINQVKTDMGCTASRTIQFATGFGIIRFGHLGFALFDGINDRLISEEVRPYIFGDVATQGVDFARLTKAHATLCASPPLYVCSMPTRDNLTTRIFVYDLVMRAWMIIDYCNSSPNFPISCMSQLRPPYQSHFNATTVVADFGGGQASIRRFQGGDPTWDAFVPAQAIQWSFRPPEVGEPGSRAYFRRANVRLTAPGPGTISGSFSIGEESQPLNSRLEGGAGPSSGMPPNVATSSANYWNTNDLGVALDIHQTGPSLNGTFSGSGPANIEGVDYHITAKEPRPFGQRF